MNLALDQAGVQSKEVSYINAHGTSTPYNDRSETTALKNVFGDYAKSGLMVSSTKSMTGHLLGAAGAIEAAAVWRQSMKMLFHLRSITKNPTLIAIWITFPTSQETPK